MVIANAVPAAKNLITFRREMIVFSCIAEAPCCKGQCRGKERPMSNVQMDNCIIFWYYRYYRDTLPIPASSP